MIVKNQVQSSKLARARVYELQRLRLMLSIHSTTRYIFFQITRTYNRAKPIVSDRMFERIKAMCPDIDHILTPDRQGHLGHEYLSIITCIVGQPFGLAAGTNSRSLHQPLHSDILNCLE
jgi:hypothetical protein